MNRVVAYTLVSCTIVFLLPFSFKEFLLVRRLRWTVLSPSQNVVYGHTQERIRSTVYRRLNKCGVPGYGTFLNTEKCRGFVLWSTSHVHFVFKNSIYDRKLYRSPGQVGCVVEGGGCEGRELALFQAIRWGSHPLVNYPSTLPPSPCGSLYFSSIYLYTCNILVWLRMFLIWIRLTR